MGCQGSKGTSGPSGTHTPAYDRITGKAENWKLRELDADVLMDLLASKFIDIRNCSQSYIDYYAKFTIAEVFKEVKRRLGDNEGGTTGPTGTRGPS